MLSTFYIYFDGCVIEFISNKYKYWYDELHESEIKIQMDIDLNSKIIEIYNYHNSKKKYNIKLTTVTLVMNLEFS